MWTNVECRTRVCMTDIQRWMRKNSSILTKTSLSSWFFITNNVLSSHLNLSPSFLLIMSTILVQFKMPVSLWKDRSCYHHFQPIGKIRHYITTETCQSKVQFLAISWMDYANALLNGLLQWLLRRLQHLQNPAAHLIAHTPRGHHISLVLMYLHRLPTEFGPWYKILLHTAMTSDLHTSRIWWKCTSLQELCLSGQVLLEVPNTQTFVWKEVFQSSCPLPGKMRNVLEKETIIKQETGSWELKWAQQSKHKDNL